MLKTLRTILLGLLPLLLLLGAWQWLSGQRGQMVIPPIQKVLWIALTPLAQPQGLDAPPLLTSCLTSLLRVMLGYLLAVLIGVPLGLLMGRSRRTYELFSPLINLLRVVCPVAWLPIVLVVAGSSSIAGLIFTPAQAWQHPLLNQVQLAMVLVIGFGAFFPILLTSVSSARAVKQSLLEGAQLMGAGRWRLICDVVLPHALPQILGGMRIGLGVAWLVIIAAELLPGTRSGLGYTIWVGHEMIRYDYAMAAILYIMIIGLALNQLLSIAERRIGHWQAVQR